MSNPDYVLSKCNSVTRRRLLSAIGASVAVASAGAYGISVWGRNPDGTGIPTADGTTSTTSTTGVPLPAGIFEAIGDRTLVVIEMGGGNDGLNMVVPHADPRYHDLRGDLAVSAPIDLDGEIGLHPALTFIAERYTAGQVAIIEGVGYPGPRSLSLRIHGQLVVWLSRGCCRYRMAGKVSRRDCRLG
jgi:hypothetical protein